MQDPLTQITGILVLATIAEALVEHLFAPLVDLRDANTMEPQPGALLDWRALILRYISVFIGVLLCIVYRVDLLTTFDLSSPWPWFGYAITGILIGRGSNFIHDFAGRWLAVPEYE